MSDKNIDLSGAGISITNLNAFLKENPNVKNREQIISIFNEMDNGDGILNAEEGALYYYGDGSVSVMKNEEELGVPDIPEFRNAVASIPNPVALKKDKVFQKYRNSLIKSYKEMAQNAAAGGWKLGTDPAKIDSFAKVDHLDEWSNYTKLFSYCLKTKKALENYVKEMQNWKDGTQAGDRKIGLRTFTNTERITLLDGQRAWKCDEGVFYPYYDGLIGGPKVPNKLVP